MSEKDHLYILWTSESLVTAEKMVFMYAINSLRKGWWKEVTVIVWGAPALLIKENESMKNKVKKAIDEGVNMTACRACADQLGATDVLEELGIEVIYWGEPLTSLLKEGEQLLTI